MQPDQVFHLLLTKHTGYIIGFHQSTRALTNGTFEQCEQYYCKVQLHNLFFGWWSLPSILFANAVILYKNWKAYKHLKKLYAEGLAQSGIST